MSQRILLSVVAALALAGCDGGSPGLRDKEDEPAPRATTSTARDDPAITIAVSLPDSPRREQALAEVRRIARREARLCKTRPPRIESVECRPVRRRLDCVYELSSGTSGSVTVPPRAQPETTTIC